MNALHWASLADNPATVQALIEAGAPLNQPDHYGYTPLMYAASTDFGRSDVLNVLLAHNADAAIRTRDGKTAADLARGYGFARTVAALERQSARK